MVVAAIAIGGIARLTAMLGFEAGGSWLQNFVSHPSSELGNGSFTPSLGPYEPWTHEPICVPSNSAADYDQSLDTQYCVYTNTNFRCGRGISVVTTPAIATTIAASAAFMSDYDCERPVHYPPYQEIELPGRGTGLIANRTIEQSELLMLDSPTFLLNTNAHDELDEQPRRMLMWKGMEQLPGPTRELTLGMAKHQGGDEIDDIIATNAFYQYFGEGTIHHTVLREAAVSDIPFHLYTSKQISVAVSPPADINASAIKSRLSTEVCIWHVEFARAL
jgi:hypothetical protein